MSSEIVYAHGRIFLHESVEFVRVEGCISLRASLEMVRAQGFTIFCPRILCIHRDDRFCVHPWKLYVLRYVILLAPVDIVRAQGRTIFVFQWKFCVDRDAPFCVYLKSCGHNVTLFYVRP